MLVLIKKTAKVNGRYKGLYQCACGNEKELQLFNTESYPERVCRSCAARVSNKKEVRDLTSSRYTAMMQRCYNPKHKNYDRYGGRGIQVCKEWRDSTRSYNNYLASLPNAFKEGYSVDRIENDGNYEPSNIKWSTKAEQMNNKTQANQYG